MLITARLIKAKFIKVRLMTATQLGVLIIITATYLIICGYSAQASGLLEPTASAKLFLAESSQLRPQLTLAPALPIYRKSSLRRDFVLFARDDDFSDDAFIDGKQARESYGFRKISTIKAVALSTLLPGAGQWYIGNKRTARLFLGAEAGIWAGFAAFKVYAGWKQDDVERFATRHAGVNGLNREEQFFRQLTFYSSREEYNSLGRAFDPDLPFIPDTPENDWNWDSAESRRTFRQLFNDQNSVDRNADFMFIAALVNRLTSAALAWRSAKKHNNLLDEEVDELGATTPRKSKRATERRTTIRLVQPTPGRNASDGLMLAISHSF